MRVVIDARSASRSESAGIGALVRQLVDWLPALAPDDSFKFLPDVGKPRPISRIEWYSQFARATRPGRADLVHTPHSLVVPILSPAPTILTIHDLTALSHPQLHTRLVSESFHRFLGAAVRRARRIIVISRAVKEELSAVFPNAAERIRVIYPGVDLPIRPEDEGEPRFFLFVGTLEPRKNLRRLVDAYALARAEVGSVFPDLVFAGGRGWGSQDPRDMARAAGVEGHVHYVGYVSEQRKLELYCRAVATVFPSLAEGFGLPVLESMAAGTPVIASRIAAIEEFASNAALLVSPLDVAEIAQAMIVAATDPVERQRLARAGRIRAQAFTCRGFAAGVLAVYREAIGESSAILPSEAV